MVDRGKRRHLKNVLLEKWSPEFDSSTLSFNGQEYNEIDGEVFT